ncbi:hypothetical protein KUL42_38690 [Alteromonas sp. KUL42]|uniref:hypothetical protein n=1 Tax=Alteromonas sp. KUL42 TaxID=2480797 RepID=UPI00103578B8|nr:hypothetical protein [Alteromonas sp. KUL42]TAP31676.1 hypothetical protein EYR97_19500 [Alteromonas sp. KUL42]GEA09108.1 hypothetical protein KUL42_38690 [Alteromonas sp. KUL42]
MSDTKSKTFKEWVAHNCPTLEDKINLCFDELVQAASVVDINFAQCRLSQGKLKSRDISVYEEASKGRCRVYFNINKYNGDEFPHFVFQNFRVGYSDKMTGKACPSVVNTTGVLFEKYKEGCDLRRKSFKARINDVAPAPNRMLMVNELRRWFSKLEAYGNKGRQLEYFVNKGIHMDWVVEEPNLDIRLGYSPRYGRWSAIPMRYLHQDTFMGFVRIYKDGKKIQMREFDPSGLCHYLPSDESASDIKNVKTMILQESFVDMFFAHRMTQELGLKGVANVAGLFADNLPVLVETIENELPDITRVLLIYDNDVSQKGLMVSEVCRKICSRLSVACFERSDLSAMVVGYNYEHAKKEFAKLLKHAFSNN